MPRRPRVVVAAQDPGAANVLAPVAARLRAERRVDPVIWGLLQARAVFRRAGVPLSPGQSREVLIRRFREDPPELLLTGTNEDREGLDRVLTLEARRLGIPVLGVLDYWSNYVARYSGPGRSERFRYLPDLVFVMDPRARRDMIRLGFPPGRLRVVGHAHLERFSRQPRQPGASGRHQVRKALGVRAGEKLICFASETYGMTWDRAYRFPPLTDSRERTEIILEHLLAALDSLRRTHGLKPFVINKLHPKNRLSEFRWLSRGGRPFPIRSLRQADNQALVRASDLVVGMTSMFLLEATYLGATVLHLIPRQVEERLLQDVARRNPVARNPRDLKRQLRKLLVRPAPRDGAALRRIAALHRGAAGRIIRGVYELLAARNAFTRKKT